MKMLAHMCIAMSSMGSFDTTAPGGLLAADGSFPSGFFSNCYT
jgi:hypothetical protein